jgi:methionyl-tRNA formyltransferase
VLPVGIYGSEFFPVNGEMPPRRPRSRPPGVTVHFATEDLDSGPIILQRAVDLTPEDTIATFEDKIHLVEYALYPRALKLYAEGRLRVEGRTVTITEDVEEPPWAPGSPPGLRDE